MSGEWEYRAFRLIIIIIIIIIGDCGSYNCPKKRKIQINQKLDKNNPKYKDPKK